MSFDEAAWPPLPDWITVADDVDQESEDWCRVEGSPRRLCVSTRKAGGRCTAPALGGDRLCAAHGRQLDSALGGHVKAKRRREAEERAQYRGDIARLGTRAVVAAALAEKHSEIRLALHVLATAAAAGDVRSAQALIPWLNQGLGMPTERIEASTSASAADLAALSTAELEALVEAKRSERLRLVDEQATG